MVSIRYFLGVGEFCSVKSTPRGRLTSKTGVATAVDHSARVKKNDARNKVVNKLGIPSEQAYRLSVSACIPSHVGRRVDSRSTSVGGISIFCGRIERFAPIRANRSSAASLPIWQVP